MPRKAKDSEWSKLDASTGEEIDALRVDLVQDADEQRNPDDGTGIVEDDVARERIEELTEVGPDAGDRGVGDPAPGRDDTSAILRKHHPKSEAARSKVLVEGNLDEPRDERIVDRKVDDGTAA